MRYNTDGHFNGAICDKCKKKVLKPNDTIKIKSFMKEIDDSTGKYFQLDKADLCEECYKELKKWFGLVV